MAQFLLIHGSCHGAWCWRDMLPLLNQNGHSARAIDLPAHGQDTTPIAQCTLDGYTQKVIDAIEAPVILVGHSLAGVTLSSVAEAAPEKLQHLVYVAAWLPESGKSAKEMRALAPRQPLADAFVFADDGQSTTFHDDKIKEKFYHDCPPGILDYARKHLCAEPTLPSATPVTLGANYRSVGRSYIHCKDDRAVPHEYQLTMAENCPESNRFGMDCAHSPFFAQPDRLAEILFRIAATT